MSDIRNTPRLDEDIQENDSRIFYGEQPGGQRFIHASDIGRYLPSDFPLYPEILSALTKKAGGRYFYEGYTVYGVYAYVHNGDWACLQMLCDVTHLRAQRDITVEALDVEEKNTLINNEGRVNKGWLGTQRRRLADQYFQQDRRCVTVLLTRSL